MLRRVRIRSAEDASLIQLLNCEWPDEISFADFDLAVNDKLLTIFGLGGLARALCILHGLTDFDDS